MPGTPSLELLVAGLRQGDRSMLSKAITLVESTRADHRAQADALLDACLPFSGGARRIGITGVPGAGKSTFLNALGMHIARPTCNVAVLSIDPSSHRTGGSILGDKTRMQDLASSEYAYIRPSPNAGEPGGVALRTREAMVLCEAAGFDIIFVETVGVGQSEYRVQEMVDVLVLLTLTGSGDSLQGIKRGVLEWADLVVVNKADGDNEQRALMHRKELQQALHLLPPSRPYWTPDVLTASSTTKKGISEVWDELEAYFNSATQEGQLEDIRKDQAVVWLHRRIEHSLWTRFYTQPAVKEELKTLEQDVRSGQRSAVSAANLLLKMSG